MRSDNVIPLHKDIRAEIKREMARAVARFGKHHIEVMAISSSWGDTMDDNEVLAALRRLNKAGSIFEHITHRADDE
ncbi:hypothetical protein SAMN04488498_104314 [Mesorhizobium albiziae]|uniref:Uncharacterized protein n=1 Tax=Neomesorhizobium albiziae TaxID=335020 RepID=A0A1I3YAY1_9HYPH|nr:hypothetical protein [Mesorhizobium albiziae]GLS29981.1 hypothetical protein GCM10007937_16890 [Mesorhizobium albiziae]SFK28910.1 hypothetical protein SAMN04488498_104314 [Mesorhizobium albiziae]